MSEESKNQPKTNAGVQRVKQTQQRPPGADAYPKYDTHSNPDFDDKDLNSEGKQP